MKKYPGSRIASHDNKLKSNQVGLHSTANGGRNELDAQNRCKDGNYVLLCEEQNNVLFRSEEALLPGLLDSHCSCTWELVFPVKP